MSSQSKLLRMLRLIQLLHQKPYKTIQQLANALNVNQRTIYRYLATLEELGYLIDKTLNEQFFMFTEAEAENQLKRNLTVQEFQALDQLFALFEVNQSLLESCRRKLACQATQQQLEAGMLQPA